MNPVSPVSPVSPVFGRNGRNGRNGRRLVPLWYGYHRGTIGICNRDGIFIYPLESLLQIPIKIATFFARGCTGAANT